MDFARECRAYGIVRVLGMNHKRAVRELPPDVIEAARKHLHCLVGYHYAGDVQCAGCGAPEQYAECDYCGREL